MVFVRQASVAVILVTLTLLIQSAGIAGLIEWGSFRFTRSLHRLGPWRCAVLFVRYTNVIIVLHILQILLWAGFYRWNCFPSWGSAFYFSTATYSTLGSGDLVVPGMWRTLGAVESITGVLMFGLSAAFLFAVATLLVEHESRFSPELARLVRASFDAGTVDPEPVDREKETKK